MILFAKSGKIEFVKYFLEGGYIDVNRRYDKDKTLLMYIIGTADLDRVIGKFAKKFLNQLGGN